MFYYVLWSTSVSSYLRRDTSSLDGAAYGHFLLCIAYSLLEGCGNGCLFFFLLFVKNPKDVGSFVKTAQGQSRVRTMGLL